MPPATSFAQCVIQHWMTSQPPDIQNYIAVFGTPTLRGRTLRLTFRNANYAAGFMCLVHRMAPTNLGLSLQIGQSAPQQELGRHPK